MVPLAILVNRLPLESVPVVVKTGTSEGGRVMDLEVPMSVAEDPGAGADHGVNWPWMTLVNETPLESVPDVVKEYGIGDNDEVEGETPVIEEDTWPLLVAETPFEFVPTIDAEGPGGDVDDVNVPCNVLTNDTPEASAPEVMKEKGIPTEGFPLGVLLPCTTVVKGKSIEFLPVLVDRNEPPEVGLPLGSRIIDAEGVKLAWMTVVNGTPMAFVPVLVKENSTGTVFRDDADFWEADSAPFEDGAPGRRIETPMEVTGCPPEFNPVFVTETTTGVGEPPPEPVAVEVGIV
jgi:hypothetical protein